MNRTNQNNVIDIKNIIDQMKVNEAKALNTLSKLNKSITDKKTYDKARNTVTDLYYAGIISRRLQHHMTEELSCIYQPESYKKPQKGMHDFGTFQGIKRYIEDTDCWVIKEILIWNAFSLENNTSLDICTYNADAHYHEGDIPGNIVPLMKSWYSSISAGCAKDFHTFAREYGYET